MAYRETELEALKILYNTYTFLGQRDERSDKDIYGRHKYTIQTSVFRVYGRHVMDCFAKGDFGRLEKLLKERK